jgi:hypothetical protein
MTVPTVAIRVLEELRRCGLTLDDDQLAKRLGVSPRQTINQVCRALEAAGRLRRYVGADGKIVNDVRLAGIDTPPSAAPPPAVEKIDAPPGDSREQRRAEAVMLDLLGARLGLTLQPRRIPVGGNGARVEIDGADENLTTLVEAWAHHGRPKVAQKNKVLADALKLLHVAGTLTPSPRLVLCLCDAEAAHHFTTARSWAADALRAFGIGVEVVELPVDVREAVLTAQRRQFR